MKKFYAHGGEMDKDKKEKMKGVIHEALRIDFYDEDRIEKAFGLCSTCMNFEGAETKYGVVFARCEELRLKLKTSDPIIKCTYYIKRGAMDIEDMKEIALLIDVKRSVGFIKEE